MSDEELKDNIHKGKFVDPDVIGYLSRHRPSVLVEHMTEESEDQGQSMRDLANGIIEAVKEDHDE
jgi:hypothetical protein